LFLKFKNSGHIKNSVYFDTMHCTKPSKMYPRSLPDHDCFKDYVGSLGISNKHHLIVYDRSPFGFYAAPRTWWIFRVRDSQRKYLN
jgi:thiosulfate/3-mercaptopyruvate sulfurtransferase